MKFDGSLDRRRVFALAIFVGVAPGLAQFAVTALGGPEYRRVLQRLFSGILFLAGVWIAFSGATV